MISLPDHVRDSYTALMTGDAVTARRHCLAGVTCHVGGQHQFSGDYDGVAGITDLLQRMDEAGGDHSFTVTNVMSDDSGSQVLIEGVAVHDSYVRHVIHRLRYAEGRLAELWLKPLDQRTEDEFWSGRMPQQRAGGSGAPAEADATRS